MNNARINYSSDRNLTNTSGLGIIKKLFKFQNYKGKHYYITKNLDKNNTKQENVIKFEYKNKL